MSNVNQLIWFRQDLRVRDHAALWHASQQGPCIGLIILSPEQWKMHHDAPIKINFYLRQLQQLKKELEQLQSQFQAKAAMVASLEAQYLQRQQDFSRQQKIKTVDGIQAKKDASAIYLDKFREKVELYGNRYYPEEAKQQQLRGEVRLMVILNAQGGIRAIRLLESSGHSILDEAAKSSVRRGAPFGHFDANMKDISELRIVRTWRFDPAEAEFEVH
ncbi:tonB family C-terminal domain protein [Acinetobacter sp. 1475718]|nr:TonB family protein [Acinetobacter sp. 1475718]EXB62776.1 tonB family C-terminal domain protein [Acinetobacter sp. 1475718]